MPVMSLLAGLLVALFVLSLRETGLLEPLELKLYDSLVRSRPESVGPDPRITLIAITEEDIDTQGGQYPISDATLVTVLDRLIQHHPRAIGLDIYRNYQVPPGRREELEGLLAKNRHIITVTRVGGVHVRGVPPPSVLPHLR